jgi:flagellar hook-basal body complex protein FliE
MQAKGLDKLDLALPDGPGGPARMAPGGFVSVMQGAIEQVSRSHRQAHAQVQSLREGQTQARWEEVACSLQEAQAALQHMMTLRDQLVSVYQDLRTDRAP